MKMKKRKGQKGGFLKQTWDFLWNGDSLLSWVAFVVVIFVFIKLIFFPLLSLATGTVLPLAIVESCSMHHDDKFDGWWDENKNWYEGRDIEKENFESFPLKNGFSKGDIFFVLGTKKEKLKIGDVIIFSGGKNDRPIIHRVVGLDTLETKGDNNPSQFSSRKNSKQNPEEIDETDIKEEKIIGKVTPIRIPFIGWIKLIFFEPFRSEDSKGFCK